ncbi:hypothetical protein L596_025606 [Steinernema carpocapsae]|uniref:Uncharacterized protein n=1 Tax=Steinernema carpocapsae TaxID=34508 RepID=A0A4U5M890_STECR|nr:hypothetical protein L596_025606 [Steinernema carpocapsae]
MESPRLRAVLACGSPFTGLACGSPFTGLAFGSPFTGLAFGSPARAAQHVKAPLALVRPVYEAQGIYEAQEPALTPRRCSPAARRFTGLAFGSPVIAKMNDSKQK